MNKSKKRIVVATRKSELALAQCRQFLARLSQKHPHLEIEELHVVTTGDKILDQPLASIGGKGLFLKEIEETLLDGTADFAVHSMKDVPPQLYEGLTIACVPEREDPRDVIITTDGRLLSEMPEGSVLGTSSLRRGVQLLKQRPDLKVVPIRGNVGTRIRKCREGEVDITVLARAGINRLKLQREVSETLTAEYCLPAVGQGALAIEIRDEDEEMRQLLSVLSHEETLLCTTCERGVMTAVDGDCKTPVAAFAQKIGSSVRLRGLLANPDGSHLRVEDILRPWPETVTEAHALGHSLGEKLKNA